MKINTDCMPGEVGKGKEKEEGDDEGLKVSAESEKERCAMGDKEERKSLVPT